MLTQTQKGMIHTHIYCYITMLSPSKKSEKTINKLVEIIRDAYSGNKYITQDDYQSSRIDKLSVAVLQYELSGIFNSDVWLLNKLGIINNKRDHDSGILSEADVRRLAPEIKQYAAYETKSIMARLFSSIPYDLGFLSYATCGDLGREYSFGSMKP